MCLWFGAGVSGTLSFFLSEVRQASLRYPGCLLRGGSVLATTPVFGLTEPTDLGGNVLVHTRYRATPLGQEGFNAVSILRPSKPGARALGCPYSAWLPSSACGSAPGQLGNPAPLLCHAEAGEPNPSHYRPNFSHSASQTCPLTLWTPPSVSSEAKPEAVGGLP